MPKWERTSLKNSPVVKSFIAPSDKKESPQSTGIFSQSEKASSQGRWLVARYFSHCKECESLIKPGDDLWYIPLNKITACSACEHKRYTL